MANPNPVTDFSEHLFWDTPVENVDVEKHRRWLVKRVLEKGRKEDWDRLLSLYGKAAVGDAVKTMRSLERKAFRFACAMLDLEPTDCRCFTNAPFHSTLWNY